MVLAVPPLWSLGRQGVLVMLQAWPQYVGELAALATTLDIVCWLILAYSAPALLIGVVSRLVAATGMTGPPRIVRRLVIVTLSLWLAVYGLARSLDVDAIWVAAVVVGVLLPLSFVFRRSIADLGAGIRLTTTGMLSEGMQAEVASLGSVTIVRLGVTSTMLQVADGRVVAMPNSRMLDATVLRPIPGAVGGLPQLYWCQFTFDAHPSIPESTLLSASWSAAVHAGVSVDLPRPRIRAIGLSTQGTTYEVSVPCQDHADRAQRLSATIGHLGRELQHRGIAREGALPQPPTPEQLVLSQRLFAALSDAERADLAQACSRVQLDEGEILCRQGEPGVAMWIVGWGALEVRLAQDGDADAVVATIGGGQLVGEMALITGDQRTATVRALSPTEVLELQFSALQPLIQARPDLADSLAEYADARHAAAAAELGSTPEPSRLRALAQIIRAAFGLDGSIAG